MIKLAEEYTILKKSKIGGRSAVSTYEEERITIGVKL